MWTKCRWKNSTISLWRRERRAVRGAVRSIDPNLERLELRSLEAQIALLACLVPALRAARVDPMVVLREE